MIDYHLHTARCGHASGTMEQYIEEAIRKDLTEIGFADHFPLGLLGVAQRVKVSMEPAELEEYIDMVEQFKKSVPELKIKLGTEVDYVPGKEERIELLLKEYPFDYVIGSIHFMDDWDFTHPAHEESYHNRNIEELYAKYFALVDEACLSGLFDVIGHIDIIKKFGFRPHVGLEEHWEKTAGVLKSTGTAIELNTAGRDAPVGDFYPDFPFLKKCAARGVAVTLGSDAHKPEQVGRYFPEALLMLKEAGYKEITVFEKRKKQTVSLV